MSKNLSYKIIYCGNDYRENVENGGYILRKIYAFKITLHNVYTFTKILPWGHYDITV